VRQNSALSEMLNEVDAVASVATTVLIPRTRNTLWLKQNATRNMQDCEFGAGHVIHCEMEDTCYEGSTFRGTSGEALMHVDCSSSRNICGRGKRTKATTGKRGDHICNVCCMHRTVYRCSETFCCCQVLECHQGFAVQHYTT
jgi:hypothetical protein